MLLRGLPQESRYQTILRDTLEIDGPDDGDPTFGPWSLENYQMAALIDSVRELQRVTAQVHSDKPLDPIEPSPRPRVKRRASGPEPAALAYLQEIRDRHRREAAL